MTNAEVARVFTEIADLMEIQGIDGFRVNAYRRVARTIEDLASDIRDIAASGELDRLQGVGKSSAEKILELLATGKLALRDELSREVPDSLLELRAIPGMGPKKIALLWKERGVRSLAELKAALDTGDLETLKGFGKKSVEQIRQGIEFVARSAGRVRLGVASEIAERVKEYVRSIPGVQRVEHAGSLRRGCETIGDIDLLCIGDDGEQIVKAFTEAPGVQQVFGAGETKGSVLVEHGKRTIQVDLRVVPPDSFGAAWQYFTGSKEHNIRLREMAQKRGWTLNEYGLSDGKKVIASRTEEEIYAALGMPWIPPELREDRGEFALTAAPVELLQLGDIRGDLHMHTTASDGRCTIEQMVESAKRRGYEYVCITDHSQSSFVANGLTAARLKEHIGAVRAVSDAMQGITVWVGAEVDILADGRMDYPDDVLAELDFVIASIHVGMSHDIAVNTKRTLAAIRNPYVNLIAHPTGRLINRREAFPIDIEAVCKEAAATGTALEINASTYRLDLKDQHARLARDTGVAICIDTDAHHTDQLDQMQYGVLTARRAGLRKTDVLNTQSADGIMTFVRKKRAATAAQNRSS